MNIYVNGEYQIISTDYFLSLFGELFLKWQKRRNNVFTIKTYRYSLRRIGQRTR